METTEKIVEAYCRYIKGWATIPNIKCAGQHEIDLLAIDPLTLGKYHIESGVSISGSFSSLTAKPFSWEDLKQRTKQAGQRRTLGYFLEHKFSPQGVLDQLQAYGFSPGNYTRIIVTWGCEEEAEKQAEIHGVKIWKFPALLQEIAQAFKKKRSYFTDDTLRTLQLFSLSSISKLKTQNSKLS